MRYRRPKPAENGVASALCAWQSPCVEANEGGATERVWAMIDEEARAALQERLSPTDLQTLLLAVARTRAATVSPARVLQRWREDSFVRPAAIDARALSSLEAELWQQLTAEFDGVELSPLAPFGACAVLGGVDQNRVVTTMRMSEVVSDPTVLLAVEAAARRQRSRATPVNLASCHRVLRAQRFPAPYSQHFRLLALVSSDRDRGSGHTEATLLTTHLGYYVTALSALFPEDVIRVRLSRFSDGAAAERAVDTVFPALHPLPVNVEVAEDPSREHGRGYYRDVAIRLHLFHEGEEIEIGDGGFTDWTSRLIPDAKERCLTSCIATERLAAVRAM